jgi:hypothetical protein
MRPSIVLFAGMVAGLTGGIATAAEEGFYFGAAVGEATTSEKIGLGSTFDDRDSSFKVIGGWRPFDWFAVEGSYFDLGDVRLLTNVPDLSPFRLRQTGYEASAMFLIEIGMFDLFGKAGIVRSSADLNTNTILGPLKFTDEDTDLAWGLGAQARFDRIATRIEWQRLEISNGDSFRVPKVLSFGITWTFGGD